MERVNTISARDLASIGVATVLSFGLLASPAAAQGTRIIDFGAFVPTATDGLSDGEIAAGAVQRAPAVSGANAAALGVEAVRDGTRVGAYPRLTLEASYTRLSATPDEPLEFGGAVIDNPFETPLDRTLFRATLDFPVTRAVLAVLPGLEAADHALRAAELRTEAVARQVDLQSRVSWLDYVRLLAQRSVADDGLRQLHALRSDVSALVERELRPRADLAEVDAAIAEARLEVTRLEGAIELSRRAVSRISGLEIGADDPIGTATFRPLDVPVTDAVAAFELAMESRPEVLGVRTALEAMDARRRATRADRYPSLTLVANADLANPNDRYVPPVDRFEESWAVSVVASWSPNSLAASRHADRELQADAISLESDLAALEDQLFVEVNEALVNVATADAAIEAAVAGVDAAAVALDAATRRNAAGLGTAREVLDAELALRRAQSSLVDAHLQRRVAVTRLTWSIGIPL